MKKETIDNNLLNNEISFLTNEIGTDISKIMELNSKPIDDIQNHLKKVKDGDKDIILENMLNNSLNMLRKECTIEKYKQISPRIDEVMDYYMNYARENLSEIDYECIDISTDILFKVLGYNDRKLQLPISISNIKDYSLTLNIKGSQVYDAIILIIIRLMIIEKCIKEL